MFFQTVEISIDDVFSQKPKHVANIKTDINVVVTDRLYFLSVVRITQQNVIDKDVDERSACRSGYFTPGGNPPSYIKEKTGWNTEPAWKLWRRENYFARAKNRNSISRPSNT
jgi:hypothetical protein